MGKNTTVKKQCITCKQILPISKFRRYKNRSGSIGYRGYCRECEKAQERERFQKKEKTQSTIEKEMQPDVFRFIDMYRKVRGG